MPTVTIATPAIPTPVIPAAVVPAAAVLAAANVTRVMETTQRANARTIRKKEGNIPTVQNIRGKVTLEDLAGLSYEPICCHCLFASVSMCCSHANNAILCITILHAYMIFSNFRLTNARVVHQPPDGSCLFHALNYGIQGSGDIALRRYAHASTHPSALFISLLQMFTHARTDRQIAQFIRNNEDTKVSDNSFAV